MDKHSLQLLLAQGVSVERIAVRFGKDPSTISYWLAKYGLTSPYASKHAAKGVLERQQLEECVQSGMTIAEIADVVGRSKATVRHWLKRYGLRTLNGRGTRHSGVTAAGKAAACWLSPDAVPPTATLSLCSRAVVTTAASGAEWTGLFAIGDKSRRGSLTKREADACCVVTAATWERCISTISTRQPSSLR